jgi:hypothetical protein
MQARIAELLRSFSDGIYRLSRILASLQVVQREGMILSGVTPGEQVRL